jgi:MFS family permease
MDTAHRARIAVSALFIANGLSLAVWVPRLADIQSDMGISDLQIGLALAAGAAGGLIMGPWAGWAAGRWGSARVAVVTLLLFAPITPLLAFAPGVWFLAAILLWIGGMDAVMDAAMNAHSLRVQKLYQRSIINAFHGYWALGAVSGGLIGAGSAIIGASLALTLLITAIATVGAVLLTARWLLPGPDPDSHLDPAEGADAEDLSMVDPSSVPAGGAGLLAAARRRALTPLTATLGLFTVLAVVVEMIPAQWSSIYLTSIGTPAQFIGVAFVASTAALTIGRFTGDRLVDRFGELRVVRVGMASAAIALAAGLIIGTAWSYVVAAFVAGYSVATLFPAAMRAAAHIPGIKPAAGVSMVSWLSRAGFVFAPIIVGAIANRWGPAWGIACAAACAAALVPLSAVLRQGATPPAHSSAHSP